MEELDEKMKSQLEDWIERGKLVTYPERYAEWKNYCTGYAQHTENEIDEALEIMEALDDGATFEEAKNILDKYPNKREILMVVIAYSKFGPDFYDWLDDDTYGFEFNDILNQRRRENMDLEVKHANDVKK